MRPSARVRGRRRVALQHAMNPEISEPFFSYCDKIEKNSQNIL